MSTQDEGQAAASRAQAEANIKIHLETMAIVGGAANILGAAKVKDSMRILRRALDQGPTKDPFWTESKRASFQGHLDLLIAAYPLWELQTKLNDERLAREAAQVDPVD